VEAIEKEHTSVEVWLPSVHVDVPLTTLSVPYGVGQ
jgi:hypothetical protein